MNDKILYVEDDETLAFLTQDSLTDEGYDLYHFVDGESAYKAFRSDNYDLCIIDVMLPVMDGFTLAEKIRRLNTQVPIIFVTAKSMKEDKIKGLTIGADDYITKPFSIEELLLKINVFLRRRFINNQEKNSYELGQYTFDFKNLLLSIDDDVSNLTQREGELLQQLLEHKEEIISRKNLLERVWGKEDYFLGRSMDVFISRLRKHLSKDPQVKIENIHGVGFRLTTQSGD